MVKKMSKADQEAFWNAMKQGEKKEAEKHPIKAAFNSGEPLMGTVKKPNKKSTDK